MDNNLNTKRSDNPGLHSVAVYNPSLWNDDELSRYFVARHEVLEKITKRLSTQQPNLPAQHQLIIGQRGMGKSTLLQRISLAVRQDEALNNVWIPLTFPEEQYNIKDLKDLWLNTLDALGDRLEAQGALDSADKLDELIDRVKHQSEAKVLAALVESADKLKKRLLLLIDNIDLVFERVKEQHWHLRELLQSVPQITFIGASANAIEATYDYEAAFYDFFQVIPLKPLTRSETNQVLFNLSQTHNVPVVEEILKTDSSRIHTLHTLTGGNPRTVVLLFKVLAQGIDGDVRSDLEGLLDIVTPLYKARFEELSVANQQIVDAIALNWHPISANGVAEKLSTDVNKVSSLINRLVNSGVIEKVPAATGKRLNFQISERFFNIWYLMRASRRVRKKLIWLVYFLKMFFNAKELEQQAIKRLQNQSCNEVREAEFNLALAQTVSGTTRQALEHSALYGLYRHQNHQMVDGMFDLNGEDSELKTTADRIKWLEQSRIELTAALSKRSDIELILADINDESGSNGNNNKNSIADLVENVLSAPWSIDKKRFDLEVIKTQPAERIRKLIKSIYAEKLLFKYLDINAAESLFNAMRQGILQSCFDMKGAKIAAKRFENSNLLNVITFWNLLSGRGDKQELTAICDNALIDHEQNNNNPFAYLLMAAYCMRYNEPEFEHYIVLANKHNIGGPYVSYIQAFNDIGNGEFKQAEQALISISQQYANFGYDWLLLGLLYKNELNQPQQAVQSLEKLMQLCGESSLVSFYLAAIYHYQLNNPELAINYYQQAIEGFSTPVGAYLGLSQALEQLGNYSGAQSALTKAKQQGVNQLVEYLEFCFDLNYFNHPQSSFNHFIGLVELCDDSNSEQLTESWPVIIYLVSALLEHIPAQDFADKISQASDAIFWRALQYALKALADDSDKILNALAPELRGPAEDILADLKQTLNSNLGSNSNG